VNKTIAAAGLIAAILLMAGIGFALMPQLFGLWAILAIFALIISGHQGEGFVSLTALAAAVLTAVMLRHDVLEVLLMALIPGMAAGMLTARGASLGRVLSGGCAAIVLGLGSWWLYQYYLQGQPIAIHPLETAFALYFETFLDTLKASGLSEMYDAQGLTAPVLQEIFRNFLRGLEKLRPGLYIMDNWIRMLLGALLARVALKNRGLLQSPDFTRQHMAWQLDWVIILGLVLWLSGQQWNLPGASQAGANVLFLLAPIAFYFGLSLTVYLVRHWKLRPWLLLLLGIITLFLPVQTVLFITILGVFDPLIDYRNLDGKRGSPA